IDSFMYFGTDDLFLPSLAWFLKPGGQIGIALSGLTRELNEGIPTHLSQWWSQDQLWCLHSAEWWRRHWAQTGLVDIKVADTLPDGWRFWLDSLRVIAPDNTTELRALETDAGQNIGYVRIVGHRRSDARVFEPVVSIPSEYEKRPLLRGSE
ncbi:MAG: hypothetical protein AB7F89_25100, partial [Pirellulaceae bacterium]